MHDQLPPPLWKNIISLRYASSLNRHQLYTVIVAKKVPLGNRLGWPGESPWLARRIEDVRSPLTTSSRQNANTTLSLQLLMKFGNIVRVETSRYLTKIATLRRKADREVWSSCSQVWVFASIASELAYRSEIIFFQVAVYRPLTPLTI